MFYKHIPPLPPSLPPSPLPPLLALIKSYFPLIASRIKRPMKIAFPKGPFEHRPGGRGREESLAEAMAGGS